MNLYFLVKSSLSREKFRTLMNYLHSMIPFCCTQITATLAFYGISAAHTDHSYICFLLDLFLQDFFCHTHHNYIMQATKQLRAANISHCQWTLKPLFQDENPLPLPLQFKGLSANDQQCYNLEWECKAQFVWLLLDEKQYSTYFQEENGWDMSNADQRTWHLRGAI